VVPDLRSQLHRGQLFTKLKGGELVPLTGTSAIFESSERHYLDTPATYIREMAAGPKEYPGRLLITSAKVGFVGQSGHEARWVKVVNAHSVSDQLVISTSLARGDLIYEVDDPEMAAAMATGANRNAMRLNSSGGSNHDTRRISAAIRTAGLPAR